MDIVVIISANAEWRAVKELIPNVQVRMTKVGEYFDTRLADGRPVRFFHGGWGKVSAAATAQYAIDSFAPSLIVNLGTCGGIAGRIERGAVILVERTLIYDIVEQMSDSEEAIKHYSTTIYLGWLPQPDPHPVQRGLLVSADRDIVVQDIPMLVERYGAVAADWESGAIAWVAKKNEVRVLILRGVSDLVGSDGGEAYGDYELFAQRTREVMKELLEQLPDWIA